MTIRTSWAVALSLILVGPLGCKRDESREAARAQEEVAEKERELQEAKRKAAEERAEAREEIREDQRERATDEPTRDLQPVAGAEQRQTITGIVQRTTTDSILIDRQGMAPLSLTVDPQTEIRLGGNIHKITDLTPGTEVRAQYRMPASGSDLPAIAERIEADSAAGGARPAATEGAAPGNLPPSSPPGTSAPTTPGGDPQGGMPGTSGQPGTGAGDTTQPQGTQPTTQPQDTERPAIQPTPSESR